MTIGQPVSDRLANGLSPIGAFAFWMVFYPFAFLSALTLVVSASLMFWGPALILAIPVWLVLHLLTLRAWPYCTCAGALWAFIATYFMFRDDEMWMGPFFRDNPALGRIENATVMGIIGAVTALAMWRVAYGSGSPFRARNKPG
jgi:hypothetical protein